MRGEVVYRMSSQRISVCRYEVAVHKVVFFKSRLRRFSIFISTVQTIHTANDISYESYDQELWNRHTFGCNFGQWPELS